MGLILWLITGIILIFFLLGFRIVRPTQRGLVETFGKYSRFATPGLNYIIPFVQRMIKVNITENMADARKQDVITKDRLNTTVDAVIFYKVKPNEQDVKASQYGVDEYGSQIITKARTALRNIVGDMRYEDANSKRGEINKDLLQQLKQEVRTWGVEVIGAEMKEIDPPKDVQDSMNQVIKAENEKNAAVDFATAKETEADGIKRAAIKEAEGIAKGRIIVAEAEAKKIKLVNEAANKYFIGNAQKLKKLDVTQSSLEKNSKIVLGTDNQSILKLFDLNKIK